MRIDVDKSAELSKHYGIHSVPVFILFSKGEIVWKHQGIVSEEEIRAQVDKYL